MANLQNTVKAFVKLGQFLGQYKISGTVENPNVKGNELFFHQFDKKIALAVKHNGWFTEENIRFAIIKWAELLTENTLNEWLSQYTFNANTSSKDIAIIMAGNIPLVGFHDFLSVLVTGHTVIVKQSSNDNQLLPMIADFLKYVQPDLQNKITFTEGILPDFDAAIATGSNNTARYFDYYFSKRPSIIRKNRNSIAILTGNESNSQLKALGEDIFRYFGLGCRNVSKIFVPENYEFDHLFNALYDWKTIINHHKYANNYDYNKAVYLMGSTPILDNNFLILKEDTGYASPIGVLFYEYYSDVNSLKEKLNEHPEAIQCVVSSGFDKKEVAFGKTQHPQLWDYADAIDTVDFLLKI
ncbi:acyl-CoA reductase [Leptobacterium sp. I13]|uniref:acyl-CoA reductase n=1 Tax=Leptobacterium meishanense TaxID=3128904 RepID=UPI0030EDF168